MIILIDGPSRSGKLLLAKLLLSTPRLAFQHYSGDLERILESIYFAREHNESLAFLAELLRMNLVHTIDDLRSGRQVSINPCDSSFYRNSQFFKQYAASFEDGTIQDVLSQQCQGFLLHTHESSLFLKTIYSMPATSCIFHEFIQCHLSIIRNPASQALSWLSRDYHRSWSTDSPRSPFMLYQSNYNLKTLSQSSVTRFPWFVDKCLVHYLDMKLITHDDIARLDIVELLTLCVCYLTEVYLQPIIGNKFSASIGGHLVFHENLHDNECDDVRVILMKQNLPFAKDILSARSDLETSSLRFGRASILPNLNKLASLIKTRNVEEVLQLVSRRYCDHLS